MPKRLFCPQCNTWVDEPSVNTPGPEWVRFHTGVCPKCKAHLQENQPPTVLTNDTANKSKTAAKSGLQNTVKKEGKGILNRFFRRNKCPNCGFDLKKSNRVIGMTSGVLNVRCPVCGTNVSDRIDIVDLRPEVERQVELVAQKSLGGEDEQLAQRIVFLQKQGNTSNAKSEIRKIGEYLGANGMDTRMVRVAYRVEALGGSSRQLEVDWQGICDWIP